MRAWTRRRTRRDHDGTSDSWSSGLENSENTVADDVDDDRSKFTMDGIATSTLDAWQVAQRRHRRRVRMNCVTSSRQRVIVSSGIFALILFFVQLHCHWHLPLPDSSFSKKATAISSLRTNITPMRALEEHNTISETLTTSDEDTLDQRDSYPEQMLTIYAEPTTTFQPELVPLPRRNVDRSKLKRFRFPPPTNYGYCYNKNENSEVVKHVPASSFLPIDSFPDEDPFLPWIHDYFVANDTAESLSTLQVHFVAQNKRRCQTGKGKEGVMKYWEPQMALFQPVAVQRLVHEAGGFNQSKTTAVDDKIHDFNHSVYLDDQSKPYVLSSVEEATFAETRFLCQFHDNHGHRQTTFSKFKFNYEYVSWRKRDRPMFRKEGKDVDQLESSQLLFSCPVPTSFQPYLIDGSAKHASGDNTPLVWLDLVPIRTPARYEQGFLLGEKHIGHRYFSKMPKFNTTHHYGTQNYLPAIEDSGRWANLPLCLVESPPSPAMTSFGLTKSKQMKGGDSLPLNNTKRHDFVACTWLATNYHRRGEAHMVDDTIDRLREWMIFHRLVGLDHLYIYDNSISSTVTGNDSPVIAIAKEFPGFVTVIPWPGKFDNKT